MFEEIIANSFFQSIISWGLLAWGLTWELLAMWKAVKKNHVFWFIVLFVVQLLGSISIIFSIAGTFGILAILYYFIFSRIKIEKDKFQFEKWKKKSEKKKG